MNRRALLKSALAGAVASCMRWLPMPRMPEVAEDKAGTMILWNAEAERWEKHETVTMRTPAMIWDTIMKQAGIKPEIVPGRVLEYYRP